LALRHCKKIADLMHAAKRLWPLRRHHSMRVLIAEAAHGVTTMVPMCAFSMKAI